MSNSCEDWPIMETYLEIRERIRDSIDAFLIRLHGFESRLEQEYEVDLSPANLILTGNECNKFHLG